jgi:predicted O-linked N-acetylglucosamine transferase (SPINDLY family)
MNDDKRAAEALAAHRAGQLDQAERLYRQALDAGHSDLRLHVLRAAALIDLQRGDEALAELDQCLMRAPGHVPAGMLRGDLLAQLGRHDEAILQFRHLLGVGPNNEDAWYRLGTVEFGLQRLEAAVQSLSAAIRLKPDYFEALVLRGNAFLFAGDAGRAFADYDAAARLQPASAGLLYNRGTAAKQLGRMEQALKDHARAFAIDPHLPYLEGALLESRMQVCDWRDFDKQVAALLVHVEQGLPAAMPFVLMPLPASPALQRKAAENYAARKFPAAPRPPRAVRREKKRIRLAYLSGGLRNHATALLMVELFERHDRMRFETIGVALAPGDGSALRQRVEAAFDHFIDGAALDDGALLERLAKLDIDIAIDIDVFTAGSRSPIIARCPAPIRVNYLGYPGTSGASYLDYIVVDAVIAPPGSENEFSEAVVRLPHCYQSNSARTVGETPSRAACGLPENGLVFAALHNAFKITPDLFSAWMRILQKVPGSVLWLLEANEIQKANLIREAAARGVDGARLVFAPKLDQAEHLARHAHADLFLDTWHCNGHTTGSDALWCGVPLITCVGAAFPGRVGASLLTAAGLPELITRSLAEYEALAIRLAQNPVSLAALKEKLRAARETAPLFDVDASARALERAYERMWERERHGLAPQGFDL